MEKVLKLYTYVDGTNDTKFPSEEEQVIVSTFRYDAKRMGGAPSISCSVLHTQCLDKLWTDSVYATFNGERFFIKQVPTSSYDNTDSRYKHELELVSERIVLDNVYFYDVVDSNSIDDRPVSNSSRFTFFGDVKEFAKRLNESLRYSNVGYSVVVDSGISSEAKMVSFEDQFFSNVLQEIYNTYSIPYYFVGKVIHIGYTNNAITHTFKYGQDESLLSIQKQNANYKIVNRVTGIGSQDNIPYYYPNDYESKEEVEANGGTWINPQPNLMPSIYRDTLGKERFYSALNDKYLIPNSTEYYEFSNPYIVGKPKEHIVNFEDIKPTIKGITNSNGLRIDMFQDFAYDSSDNDETDEEGNYLHPYFFAKLRKFNGAHGFNLFDHSIEEQEMVISMTSGSCGACEFVIGVDESTQKNIVQVDEYGNLKRDDNGNVMFGEAQDQQNDTINNEVWIALRKDIDTFGVIMPNATNNYKPSVNDTFVILHIDLPKSYILAAENKLKQQLIEYMAMNNSEKFNFSISFSRIFFAENPEILSDLNENARIQIEYDNTRYELYISTYSYSMSNDKPLPEIKVELTDTLTISQNALQTAINDIKNEIIAGGGGVNGGDLLKQGLRYFLRKDKADRTPYSLGVGGNLTVDKDISVGESIHSKEFVSGFLGGQGWAIRMKEFLNSAGAIEKRSEAEVDDLIVRGTLRVFEFIVSQMLGENDNRTFTAMLEVDHYDPITGMVWLDTQGGKFYNPFRVDDIILVQQFNGMPNEENDYYITKQYELVISDVGVGDLSLGEDRLDWVKIRNFSSPMEGTTERLITKGDTFVRIDNLSNPDRKGIIQLMTVGADTPYMDIIYGKKTDPDNSLKGRFGNLKGVYNPLFGWLSDFGAYLTNLYAVGEFRIAHTGDDVSDAIEMTRGAFKTNFKQVMFYVTEEENYLTNGAFAGDLSMWEMGETDLDFLTVEGKPVYANRNLMSVCDTFCGMDEFMSREMFRIYDNKIIQLNEYIDKPKTHKEYSNTETDSDDLEANLEVVETEVVDTLYVRMSFYCRKDGNLWIGFVDDNGNPIISEEEDALTNQSISIKQSIDEQIIEFSGKWNGVGNFTISTTGDIYIDLVTITDRPLENYQVTTETWIEQDARRIALLGRKTAENGTLITNLGIELNALEERITLFALQEDLDDVLAKYSELEITVNGISSTVTSVKGTADDAKALANSAQSAADNAYSRANSAYSLADRAWDKADNAESDAATAVTQSANAISLLAARFNEDGSLKNTSGLVIASDFTELSTRVGDVEASISTFVTNDDMDNAISNIQLTADKITFEGYTNINNRFVVYSDGTVNIGKFVVDANGLSTTVVNAYINFNFDGYKFLRINNSSDPALLYGRNDDSIVAQFNTYGSGKALYLYCNHKSGYALHTYGRVLLEGIDSNRAVRIHNGCYFTNWFELRYQASSSSNARFSADAYNRLMIYSAYWPLESSVSNGYMYVDGSGYVKVKGATRV